MLTFIIALALCINGHVPTKTDLGIKETAFVFDDQKAFYNLTDTKKKKRR